MTRALLLAHRSGSTAQVVLEWGAGYGLPGGGLHPSDAQARRRAQVAEGDAATQLDGVDPGHASEVTVLRAFFVATGVLLADQPAGPGRLGAGGDALAASRADFVALRETFREDVATGAARFAQLGLAWHTDRLQRLTVRRSRGDVLREDAVYYALALSEDEARRAQAADATHYLARWSVGDLALADFVPALLRRLAAGQLDHVALDSEDACEPAPGIRMLPVRSPTLPPAAHTNIFLVGGRTAVLVEPATPFPDELDRICEWVEEAEAEGTVVLAICATHHHPDHIGGALALQARLGLPLWAHAKTADALLGKVEFDDLLEDGQQLELALHEEGETLTLTCVHTPGHAHGHLCFFEPRSRAMIAGDMVAGLGSILVEKHDGDMALYLESLGRMKALRPACLLPAHGGVIVDPDACLDHYVAHRLAREEQVARALLALGEGGPVQLVPHAYADTPRMLWPLAARALEAHLIHLQAHGRAEDLGDGRYRKTETTGAAPAPTESPLEPS